MNEEQIEGLVAANLALAARVDALVAAVLVLARHNGMEAAKMRELLEAVRRNAHQKRLERIEDPSPHLSAQADLRAIADVELDPEILDQLRWDDEEREQGS